MTKIPRRQSSATRYVAAAVCLISAMVCLPAGFIQMVGSLERGGYGTTAIGYAVSWLALGGGLLGLGIALMIWELSVRHGVRH